MSLVTVLYLTGLISKAITALGISLFVGLIVFFTSIIYVLIEGDSEDNPYVKKGFYVDFIKQNLKKFAAILLLILTAIVFIPSERTMYLMVSSHYIGKTDIPEKVLKILNEKLDKIMEKNNE